MLHTRVPKQLEEDLKSAAQALRVPVSNLVRNILEEAFQLADRATQEVEGRIGRAAQALRDEGEALERRMRDLAGDEQPELQRCTTDAPACRPMRRGAPARRGRWSGRRRGHQQGQAPHDSSRSRTDEGERDES